MRGLEALEGADERRDAGVPHADDGERARQHAVRPVEPAAAQGGVVPGFEVLDGVVAVGGGAVAGGGRGRWGSGGREVGGEGGGVRVGWLGEGVVGGGVRVGLLFVEMDGVDVVWLVACGGGSALQVEDLLLQRRAV